MAMDTQVESTGISPFIHWDPGSKVKSPLKIMLKESLEGLQETGEKK